MDCPSLELLERIAGDSPTELERPLLRHVVECSSCRQMLDEVRENLGLMGVVRAAAPGGSSAPPATLRPAAARRPEIPGYTIEAEISRGGQGVVYRAQQHSTRRTVAIKLLLDGRLGAPGAHARFEREIEILSHLRHPNIVTVFDTGVIADGPYLVMDYVDGCSLHEHVRAGGLAPRATLALMAQVCDAVQAAHLRGVIHRDLKPGNIRVDRSGRPHVLDFGLARDVSQADETRVTRTGQFLGSLPWCSPEQVAGSPDAVDVRSDVYALGVVLYQVLTGDFPYPVEGPLAEVIERIRSVAPRPPAQRDRRLDREIDTIVLTCLAKEPARRYQSAGALAADLRNYLAGRPLDARRDSFGYLARKLLLRNRAFIGGAVLAVIAALSLAGYLVIDQRARGLERRQHTAELADLYEQLAYQSFAAVSPAQADATLRTVERLELDPTRAGLIRAMLALGRQDKPAAVRELDQVLARDGQQVEALYLSAYALASADRPADQLPQFVEAERLGPRSPEALLFSGLALHPRRPHEAMERYWDALRQREFPRARVELARAYNQRLYRERTPELAEAARLRLGLVNESPEFKALPGALLSINCRLSAEIAAAAEPPDAQRAAELYEEALDWARQAQEQDPAANEPLRAEAECLESMGALDEALAVRTQALEHARAPRRNLHAETENLYYRWRLYFWTGRPDDALRDLQRLALSDYPFEPLSRAKFGHFFRALVLAEAGDLLAARQALGALAADEPRLHLWKAAFAELVGDPDTAAAEWAALELIAPETGPDVAPEVAGWRQILAHVRGELSADELLRLAREGAAEEAFWRPRFAEAAYFAGLHALAGGRRDEAHRLLRTAWLAFDTETGYTYAARLLLPRLEAAPGWPDWIAAPAGDAPEQPEALQPSEAPDASEQTDAPEQADEPAQPNGRTDNLIGAPASDVTLFHNRSTRSRIERVLPELSHVPA